MQTISRAGSLPVKIEIQFRLPYLLGLPEGEYQISPRQRILRITHPEMLYYTTYEGPQQLSCQNRSVVQMSFVISEEPDSLEDEFKRCVGITLSDTNQLIRWYRYLSKDYRAIEVVREQVSPIIATVSTEDSLLSYEIHFRRPLPRPELLTEEQLSQLSANLRLRGTPPTSELLLLDAQEALTQYRYRETVLLAWSAIETIFDPFIREKLLERFPDLNFDRGGAGVNIENDLHFLTRADVLLSLLTDFSLRVNTNPPFWDDLCDSRSHRNEIIHRGGDAGEDEAKLAVNVTQQFIRTINEFRNQ